MRMHQFIFICLLPTCLSAMVQPNTCSEKEKNTFPQELDQNRENPNISMLRFAGRFATGLRLAF